MIGSSRKLVTKPHGVTPVAPVARARGTVLDAPALVPIVLATIVLTTAILETNVHAQAIPDDDDDRIFSEAIDVFEVTVPVRVQKRGEPVRDLVAEDFVLLDRGREQTIIGFSVLERDLEHGPGQDDPGTVPPAARTEPAGSPGAQVANQRNLLLLFDAQRLAGNDPRRAFEGAREMFSRPMAPGDRWGIAIHGITVSGDRNMSARLLVGFTDDPRRLDLGVSVVEALFDRKPRRAAQILRELAGGRDTLGVLRGGQSQSTFPGIDASAALTLVATRAKRGGKTGTFGAGVPLGWLGVDAPEGLVRDTDDSWFGKSSKVKVSDGSPESRLRWFTLAMADLATFLRDVPGDNHVILLSSGGYGRMSDSFTTGRMAPMLRAFRRAGWTFQAIDVGGRGFRADDMYYMANETGGALVENVASIGEALVRVRATSDVTYRLSFRPDRIEADGKYHRLKVKLRDKSKADRVRHREGYFAPTPRSARGDLDLRLDQMRAVLGSVERQDIEVEVEVPHDAIPATRTGARARVPVVVAVDGPSLLAGHEQPIATVKIEGYVLSPGGGVIDLFVDEATFALAAVGHLAGNRLKLRRELSLPPGDHRLRVWVENVETGAITLSTTTITVPGSS